MASRLVFPCGLIDAACLRVRDNLEQQTKASFPTGSIRIYAVDRCVTWAFPEQASKFATSSIRKISLRCWNFRFDRPVMTANVSTQWEAAFNRRYHWRI